ncbi:EAL domain-containing protein [uncultured Cohaesibacter sp.]|uniref:PTS sugar transporter subunit IIC/EAL domain-containing protein n=1 Tax=uncultured Cohaesibacter sp. TaxID=1002546 RepID=UPI0029C81642|nr:EAL domain-containing protein [uncultured Cohaesibacter sp.]
MRKRIKMVRQIGDRIVRLSDWLAQKDYFVAIRRGFILPFPLIMIGALALLIRHLPFDLLGRTVPVEWLPFVFQTCDLIVSGTFGIAGLVVLSGFAAVLTHLSNKKPNRTLANPIITATVVLCCYFLLVAPSLGGDLTAAMSISRGMLAATLTASVAGIIYLKLLNMRWFRLPVSGLNQDPLVGDVFLSLPAAAVTIVIFASFKTALVFGGNSDIIHSLNTLIVAPFEGAELGLPLAIAFEMSAQIFWFFGLHGPNVLTGVSEHIFIPATIANHAMVIDGLQPQHIITSQFFDFFARIGGSGGTLSLILAMMFISKSPSNRRFALIALLPAICNINEPLLFGIPLILNPIFVIPFILVPVAQIIIGYLAITLDLMPMLSFPTAWSTPVLVSGYTVTGSEAGSIVQLVCLVAGAFIYYPFVRLSEQLSTRRNRQVLNNLLQSSIHNPMKGHPMRLIGQFDEEGRMAHSLADLLQRCLKTKTGLFLEYQPQVDIQKKRVVGVEGLLRWNHPHFGRIAPPITVALAEDLGIVDQLGYRVLEIACKQRVEWSEHLPADLLVSVNVAPRQLAERDFDVRVLEILEETGLSPKLLELEITESTALLPEMHSIDSLIRLRNAGVKIALDDFGMGFTSLHYLRLLPLDVVKIDRSLTIANSVNEQIVKSIQDLTASLNIKTIVEGVEKDEQVQTFAAHGCTVFQGYLFSHPLAASEIVPFVNGIGFSASEAETAQDLPPLDLVAERDRVSA